MSDTITIELKNIDSDDVSDVLVKVEKSFGFKFGKTELKNVTTFGELCDIITSKVQGDSSNDCTTQQAYYKLRNAILTTLLIDKNGVMADTDLQELFPRNNRKQKIAAVESELGFKTKILRPQHWITGTLAIILIASFIGLFIFWKIGLAGLIFSIIGFNLATKFANELDLQTVGQVAEKITRENYLKARRNPATVNKDEIVQEVKKLFSKDLDLEEDVLTRQATFV